MSTAITDSSGRHGVEVLNGGRIGTRIEFGPIEVRSQKSEVRTQKSEVQETGDRSWEFGSGGEKTEDGLAIR